MDVARFQEYKRRFGLWTSAILQEDPAVYGPLEVELIEHMARTEKISLNVLIKLFFTHMETLPGENADDLHAYMQDDVKLEAFLRSLFTLCQAEMSEHGLEYNANDRFEMDLEEEAQLYDEAVSDGPLRIGDYVALQDHQQLPTLLMVLDVSADAHGIVMGVDGNIVHVRWETGSENHMERAYLRRIPIN